MARDGFVTVRHDSPSFATKVPTNLPTTFRRAWALGNCGSIPPTRRDVVGSTPADHRRDTGRPRGPPTIHFEVLHEEEPMPARRRAKTRRPGPPRCEAHDAATLPRTHPGESLPLTESLGPLLYSVIPAPRPVRPVRPNRVAHFRECPACPGGPGIDARMHMLEAQGTPV